MSTRPPPSHRHWTRDFFKDHPKLAQRAHEAYSGTRGTHDKPKVFCQACLSHRIGELLAQDARDIEAGTRQVVRTSEMIILDRA